MPEAYASKRIVGRHQTYRLRAIDSLPNRWLTCRVLAFNTAGRGIAFSTSAHAPA
jgi:hypothetical protein